jgi:L-lactate dehydrogenase
MNIGIVGAGSVGATAAYSIAVAGLAGRLMMADIAVEKAEGEAMDLAHCAAFIPPLEIIAGGLEVCRDADVVVITAGARRRPDEQRTDLVRRNVEVFRQITGPLVQANPDAIFIVVSNPVDLLTLYLLRQAGLPPRRVIGSGTLLDTSRMRHLLSVRMGVDPRNVHVSVVGEHGPGAVPVWSRAQIGEIPLDAFAAQAGVVFGAEQKNELFERIVGVGQEVIRRKGATFYGVAQTVLRIITAVARDEQSILTVSVELGGFEETRDLALSLPTIVGREGALRTLDPRLSPEEAEQFRAAVTPLRALAQEVGI